MIRLSNAEHQFRRDGQKRLDDAEGILQLGTERDRVHVARELRHAGLAFIAAADAIMARIADEAEEVARHG